MIAIDLLEIFLPTKDKVEIIVFLFFPFPVNTSHEAQKGGVMPGADAVSLTRHIVEKGGNMNLKGFMTIGSFDHDLSTGMRLPIMSAKWKERFSCGGAKTHFFLLFSISLVGPNPDFVKLIETRDSICGELNLQPDDYELSMGMSGDFEHAIHLGSTNVRIGTTIFGTREVKN